MNIYLRYGVATCVQLYAKETDKIILLLGYLLMSENTKVYASVIFLLLGALIPHFLNHHEKKSLRVI